MSHLPSYTEVTTNGPAAAKRISEHTATFFNHLSAYQRSMGAAEKILRHAPPAGEDVLMSDMESNGIEMRQQASMRLDNALNLIDKIQKLGATDAVMKDLWSAYEQTQRNVI